MNIVALESCKVNNQNANQINHKKEPSFKANVVFECSSKVLVHKKLKDALNYGVGDRDAFVNKTAHELKRCTSKIGGEISFSRVGDMLNLSYTHPNGVTIKNTDPARYFAVGNLLEENPRVRNKALVNTLSETLQAQSNEAKDLASVAKPEGEMSVSNPFKTLLQSDAFDAVTPMKAISNYFKDLAKILSGGSEH